MKTSRRKQDKSLCDLGLQAKISEMQHQRHDPDKNTLKNQGLLKFKTSALQRQCSKNEKTNHRMKKKRIYLRMDLYLEYIKNP